jgi:hypothetical protein
LQVFKRNEAIPEDREKTLRKNKKAWKVRFIPKFSGYRFTDIRELPRRQGDSP